MPAFDLQCPLMSLPYAFRTTPDTVPADVPYLRADARRRDAWAQRLDAISPSGRLRVEPYGRATRATRTTKTVRYRLPRSCRLLQRTTRRS